MKSFRSALRGVIERRAPLAASLFRQLRDAIRYARLRPAKTNLGFAVVADRSIQNGSFEPAETELIQSILLNGADRLIDVGANIGYYTLLARSLGKPAVAFEPLSSNLRLLLHNLEINGWNDVEVWPVGLGDSQKIVDIFGAATGASMVAGWAGGSVAYRQRVPVTTLDTLLEGRFERERLLIKIDVEGAEYSVLRGAAKTIERLPRPVWLVEITNLHHPNGNRHFADTFEFFLGHGYSVRPAMRGSAVVSREQILQWSRDPAAEVPGYNWLFAAEDR